MSWWIQNVYTDEGNLMRCQVYADTENDLPAAVQTDYTIAYGSDGLAVDTGKKYILNGSNNWVEQPADNEWANVYTKTEVDSMFAALNILTKADLFRGEQIVANTDVNTITNYGVYYCADGTTAATLSNCPITSTGFIMIVYSTGNRVRLFYGVSATNPRIFIQAYTGGQWRTIKEATLV